MRQVLTFIMLLTSIVVIKSCQKDDKIALDPNTDIVLFENVKVIDDFDFEQYVLDVDSVYFTLQSKLELISNYNLKSGHIFISSVGNGLLRVIDSIVPKENFALIYTSQATFDEVIDQGYILFEQSLTPQMIDRIDYMVDGIKLSESSFLKNDNSIDFEFDVDLGYSINLSGNISLKSEIIFEMDVSRTLRLRKVHFGFENNTESNIELTAGGGFSFNSSITVASVYFTPIIIPTIIPIVITPILSIDVGLDGSTEASLITSIGQQFQYETGVLFERGDEWKTYNETSNDWHFMPPIVTLEAWVQAYIQPEVSMMIYGILGAYMNSRLFCEIDVTPLLTPWWHLYAGYGVGLGAKATIFGFELFDVDYPDLIADKWLIADSGDSTPDNTGIISGTVIDALSQHGLSGVTINAFKGTSLLNSTQTGSNGDYLLELPEGIDYVFEFSKPGYITAEYRNIEVIADITTYLEAVLQIDEAYSGNGTISGKVVDAFNGQGISNAELYLRQGLNTQQGPIIANTESFSDGSYVISNIPGGNYTLEVAKENYETAYSSVISIGGQSTPNQNVSLTPNIGDDEIRIILDWGALPSDLDAHLTGPIPNSGERFHIFYVNKYFYYNNDLYAALDYDIMSGYGPETITIYQKTNGIYRYSVHDYTNRYSTSSDALSASNARVRIYAGSSLLNTFHVPGSSPGTLWTVFEMDGSSIIPINTLTFESNPGNINKNSDVDLFKTLPEKK